MHILNCVNKLPSKMTIPLNILTKSMVEYIFSYILAVCGYYSSFKFSQICVHIVNKTSFFKVHFFFNEIEQFFMCLLKIFIYFSVNFLCSLPVGLFLLLICQVFFVHYGYWSFVLYTLYFIFSCLLLLFIVIYNTEIKNFIFFQYLENIVMIIICIVNIITYVFYHI